MKKGISIPISTLVILAISIIVMLAIIAWFMGVFTPSGQQMSDSQKFNMACRTWVTTNCAKGVTKDVPTDVCTAYQNMIKNSDYNCDEHYNLIASSCGCNPSMNTETTTTSSTTTTSGP